MTAYLLAALVLGGVSPPELDCDERCVAALETAVEWATANVAEHNGTAIDRVTLDLNTRRRQTLHGLQQAAVWTEAFQQVASRLQLRVSDLSTDEGWHSCRQDIRSPACQAMARSAFVSLAPITMSSDRATVSVTVRVVIAQSDPPRLAQSRTTELLLERDGDEWRVVEEELRGLS